MAKKRDSKEVSKLQGPVTKEKKKKTVASRILLVLDIVCIAAFVIGVYPLSMMLYRNIKYGEVFYINGMSMYPTLNGNAYRASNNTYLTWASGSTNLSGDLVDYGWGKPAKNQSFFDDLKRYDIVMTYYAEDYTDSTYTKLKNADNLKIKRIIGLPGETVTVSYDKNSDDYGTFFGYEVWGKTTIKDVDGNVFDLQNLYSAKDFPDITNANASTITYENYGGFITDSAASSRKTWVLGEDEYFVMGDNRRHSSDSRTKGPVKKSMINAKACLVVSKREIVRGANGEYDAKFRLDQVYAPWDFIDLEKHG